MVESIGVRCKVYFLYSVVILHVRFVNSQCSNAQLSLPRAWPTPRTTPTSALLEAPCSEREKKKSHTRRTHTVSCLIDLYYTVLTISPHPYNEHKTLPHRVRQAPRATTHKHCSGHCLLFQVVQWSSGSQQGGSHYTWPPTPAPASAFLCLRQVRHSALNGVKICKGVPFKHLRDIIS